MRSGALVTYEDISAGKIREREAANRVFDPRLIERAADPSLPAGVIKVQDSNGDWWRYPLREFEEGEQR